MKNTRTFPLPDGLEAVVGKANRMNRPVAIHRKADGKRLWKQRIGINHAGTDKQAVGHAYHRFVEQKLLGGANNG